MNYCEEDSDDYENGRSSTEQHMPVSTQAGEVRDDQGRRRFHGAWTGGFSAGYFNSVGSAEGWTPSTFTSSRTR